MEALSLSISNESFNLLAKHSEIESEKESLIADLNSFVLYSDSENKFTKAQVIEGKEFASVPDAGSMVGNINSTIRNIIDAQQQKKKLDQQIAGNTLKIEKMKKTSVGFIVMIVVIIIIIAFFMLISKN